MALFEKIRKYTDPAAAMQSKTEEYDSAYNSSYHIANLFDTSWKTKEGYKRRCLKIRLKSQFTQRNASYFSSATLIVTSNSPSFFWLISAVAAHARPSTLKDQEAVLSSNFFGFHF